MMGRFARLNPFTFYRERPDGMSGGRLQEFEQRFRKCYFLKKKVNLAISALIAALGIFSIIYIMLYDRDGLLTFRWMTVDGTFFTTVISIIFLVVGLWEIRNYTELTRISVYYLRLSAAVAEGLITLVVLLSQLPFSDEHMHILRPDMFMMHLVIPVLTIVSFVTNDSPIGKVPPLRLFRGTLFVSFYAVVIVTLILTGVIKDDMIPYFFLDVYHLPLISVFGYLILTYVFAYMLSYVIHKLNMKYSWIWFKQ